MSQGQLPPGCIQCPQCGFIGAPVVRGRAKTGFAVASSLVFLPLGILHLAANKGELACPQCGLGMGSASFFSNHERADGPNRGPLLSPGTGHRLHPWSAPSPQQYPPQYQQPYQQPHQQPHFQQGPSAAQTNSRIGVILLAGIVLTAGLCLLGMASTRTDAPSVGHLTPPQVVAAVPARASLPAPSAGRAQHRRRSAQAPAPEQRDVDTGELVGALPHGRIATPLPAVERAASTEEAPAPDDATPQRHRHHHHRR